MNIVIPAAGKGSRLGLPYPKELHRIVPGRSLIDYSLSHVRADPELVERVTLTVTPEKLAVTEYVRASLPAIDVRYSFFNDNYSEWPGSILSAAEHFMSTNVVLLPDSVITLEDGGRLLGNFQNAFAAGWDVVFAFKRVSDPRSITSLGALKIDGHSVVAFCDKPDAGRAPGFNAFWTAFGFRQAIAEPLLRMMMRSVAREPVEIGEIQGRVGGFEVLDYIDLGTWENMRVHQTREAW